MAEEYYRQQNIAKAKKWRLDNYERAKANDNLYYANNKEKISLRKKLYRENNKEKHALASKNYYTNNKEKISAHRENNKVAINAKNREKIQCDKCGTDTTRGHLHRHYKTRKCLKLAKLKPELNHIEN